MFDYKYQYYFFCLLWETMADRFIWDLILKLKSKDYFMLEYID